MAGLVIALATAALNVRASLATIGSSALPVALRQTVSISIGGESIVIPAGELMHYDFELPNRTCSITGRVVGISGGKKDFFAAIMSDDDFLNYTTKHPAKAVWQSEPRTAAATINATATGPGKYHLVISNDFSLFTRKVVTAAASADCP